MPLPPLRRILTAALPALALAAAPLDAQARKSTAPRQPAARAAAEPALPPVPREFRAVWVATVSNIDWPSRPGLPVIEQQRELLAILDRAAALGLNAVVLQVRPAGDALYPSLIEPWSEYLTGVQGQAPEPMWDPLAFAVREAHRRGLELHAWFNPFRARHSSGRSAAAPTHVSVRHPELVRQYGRSAWMDPSEPRVHDQAMRVIRDVVRRYDVDGVHIDDYFYPYQERDSLNRVIPFPDSANYARYRRAGGKMSRADWRRRHVNRFVERMYREVKQEKRRVKVGISPFGIWRPGTPAGVTGLDAYETLYADARHWLRNGWLDYWTPQLYWRAASPGQRFDVLLDWWSDENLKKRHVWPGLFTSRAAGLDRQQVWQPGEVTEQIRITRGEPRATGHVHFSMKALMGNVAGLADSLQAMYAEPALVPASPWLDRTPPLRPVVRLTEDSTGAWTVRATRGGTERPWKWVVRIRTDTLWRTIVLPGYTDAEGLEVRVPEGVPALVAVAAVDRAGNLGPSAIARPPRAPAASAARSERGGAR